MLRSLEEDCESAAGTRPPAEDIIRFEFQLRTLYQTLRSQLVKELGARKLSYSASLVLFMVNRLGSATMGEIQRALGLANSTITGLVDTLYSRGLVERYPDPADRRVTYVRPTERGNQEVAGIRAKRAEWLAAAWPAGVTHDEFEAALKLIERLTESLTALREGEESDS